MFIVALADERRIPEPSRQALVLRAEVRAANDALQFVSNFPIAESKVSAGIKAAVEEVVQEASAVRVYLAVARVAQAFETLSEPASF